MILEQPPHRCRQRVFWARVETVTDGDSAKTLSAICTSLTNQATSKRSHAAAPGEKYSAGTRTVGVPSTGSPSRTLAGCVWKDLQIGKNLKLTVDMKREYVKESVAAPPFPSLSFSLHLSLSFCLENCEPIIDRKGNRKKKKKKGFLSSSGGTVRMKCGPGNGALASFEQKVREVGRVDGLCTIVTNRKYKTLLKLKRYYVSSQSRHLGKKKKR